MQMLLESHITTVYVITGGQQGYGLMMQTYTPGTTTFIILKNHRQSSASQQTYRTMSMTFQPTAVSLK